MVHNIRGLDSGNFANESRAYRHNFDSEAALRLFRMAMRDELPLDFQLPPIEPPVTAPQAEAQVVELFPRNHQ